MQVTDTITKIISDRCMKQSAVARAAGYTPKQFNDLLHGRKRFTADDVVPICKALSITPNELFRYAQHTTT
uniref:Cro/C1-type HTH DNA-binding domain protein n=1 Tax=Myoviridae sp. ctncN39 TaxID=2825170 RepID=A0A8S5V281_9CAUD|nr:MAG TPA: Cro/C1-type HTH DNA-binding domain protein [Myoviridae sp. ctncN39]